MGKIKYFDHAATTSLLPSVKAKMIELLDVYGNASSHYSLGQESKRLIDQARADIAEFAGCEPAEIIFTSGGSEGNSQAIIGSYRAAQWLGLGNHVITTEIEHHSVLDACDYLTKCGAIVTHLGVNAEGEIDLDELDRAITRDTCLVSIMGANNEIGIIQDLYHISEICMDYGVTFHTDCVQRFGHIKRSDFDNEDIITMSGHKIGAPKGVGFMYLASGIPMFPLIHGTQENGLRGGTYNTLGVVALAEAIKELDKHIYEWNKHEFDLAVHIKKRILGEISGSYINGPRGLGIKNLPNILNFGFDGIRGEELMALLDTYGVCVSTGSACNSDSNKPSYVLKAIGCTDEQSNSSIRISLGPSNTLEEVDFAVDAIKECVEMLRR